MQAMMAETKFKQLRLSLGATQEQIVRRSRSVSLTTVKNAENGKRVTYDSATQILEAINALLAEKGQSPVALDDLGLNLY